jgi:ankyrin repeat protein
MLFVLGLVLATVAFTQSIPFVIKEPMMPANDANSGISEVDASLLKAASEGDADMVKRTLAQGADIEARDYKAGNTPLIWASFNGQLKAIKVLVERGAKLDAVSDDGHKTALLMAAYGGHADTVSYLLQRGARINHANARGDTGIAIASFMNRTAVVDSLLLHRADVSLSSRELRYTPLHLAAHRGHELVLKKLLMDGVAAKTVINAQDRDGHTPFMLATLHNRSSTAAFLLQHAQEHGIELNRKNKKGHTALALAVDKGNLGLVELFLADERLDLDVQDRQGMGLVRAFEAEIASRRGFA